MTGLNVIGDEVVGIDVVGEALLGLTDGKYVGLDDGTAEIVGDALGHINGVGWDESVGFWVGLMVGRRLHMFCREMGLSYIK